MSSVCSSPTPRSRCATRFTGSTVASSSSWPCHCAGIGSPVAWSRSHHRCMTAFCLQTNNELPSHCFLFTSSFHPIRENDECWGKGFTEWTNVTRAKPLFKGHYQPRFPADLGFYDLRLPEIREAQAALARQYGIAAFCYWHYWFGGEQTLERPFQEVLESGKPDFPFCLGWANETSEWHSVRRRGAEDHQGTNISWNWRFSESF